jgi:hypothetical protein
MKGPYCVVISEPVQTTSPRNLSFGNTAPWTSDDIALVLNQLGTVYDPSEDLGGLWIGDPQFLPGGRDRTAMSRPSVALVSTPDMAFYLVPCQFPVPG